MVSVCWNDPAGFLFKSLSLYRREPLGSVMNFPQDKVILKFYFNVMANTHTKKIRCTLVPWRVALLYFICLHDPPYWLSIIFKL